jgi:gliding motility-associated-like protein
MKHAAWVFLLFLCWGLRAQVIDTICAGSLGAIYEVAQHPDASYNWEVEGGEIVKGKDTHRITVNWGTQMGLFKISVIEKNQAGCYGEKQEAWVWVKGKSFITHARDKACMNDSVMLKAAGGINYQWSTGSTDSFTIIKLQKDTTISVIISDTVCGFTEQTFALPIKAIVKKPISLLADDTRVFKNDAINIYLTTQKTDKINWSITKPSITTPIGSGINIRFMDTGEAVVIAVAIDPFGCIDSAYKKLEIYDETVVFPTAFTPNGDGVNDLFIPQRVGVSTFTFTIYNRWGQAVFTTNKEGEGWDGNFLGQPASSDVYIYQCDMLGKSGKTYGYNGNITLLR